MKESTPNRASRTAPKLIVCFVVLFVCTTFPLGLRSLTALEQIQAHGHLHMISRNGPTTYYEGSRGLTGFEYTLAKAFADEIGVELVVDEEEDLGRMIDQVGIGKGDISAAGLTVTHKRRAKVHFSESYLQVTQQLLFRNGTKKPGLIEDIIGKNLVVIANSSHAERLLELQKRYPELSWKELPDAEMMDLMEMVHAGTVDHAIVDSNAFDINRGLYPQARVAFDIAEPEQLAWALPKDDDRSLYDAAQQFFQRIKADGTLAEVKEHYYGPVEEMSYSGALVFARRIEARLPKWEDYLKTAADKYELPWHLLAAMSYQESHWNPNARSYTGVRGLMMLTKAAAREVGVTDRVNPQQSIDGGSRYFKKIHKRIPADIQEPDRTWLALAAYNVGFGHMEDARVLTQRQGGDPDKWHDVSKRLPLLAKRKYYREAKHGYTRGWEAVSYVQNIRNFNNILAWLDQAKDRRLAVLDDNAAHVGYQQTAFDASVSDSSAQL